jgi:hypothetical protein
LNSELKPAIKHYLQLQLIATIPGRQLRIGKMVTAVQDYSTFVVTGNKVAEMLHLERTNFLFLNI